jgi:hypothetical protein
VFFQNQLGKSPNLTNIHVASSLSIPPPTFQLCKRLTILLNSTSSLQNSCFYKLVLARSLFHPTPSLKTYKTPARHHITLVNQSIDRHGITSNQDVCRVRSPCPFCKCCYCGPCPAAVPLADHGNGRHGSMHAILYDGIHLADDHDEDAATTVWYVNNDA